MSNDLPCTVAFSVFPGIGPMRFALLKEHFGSAKGAWDAKESELRSCGLGGSLVDRFVDFRKHFSIEKYLEDIAKKHIRLLAKDDPIYPTRLREIADAPLVLYIYGNGALSLLGEHQMIGVVGTRKMTAYGERVTAEITAGLVADGWCIVSGLAFGVDGIAHKTALNQKGKTIAVLGCGVDVIAPSSHASLYYDIAKSGGLIVSEMPLGHRPGKGLFPARNRIISGLSLGVVVTEGAEDSGALITASYAAEQGRDVFAVPGPVTSAYSTGPLRLMKNGAYIVASSQDITQLYLGVTKSRQKEKENVVPILEGKEEQLHVYISQTPRHIDDIVAHMGSTPSEIFSLLTNLELAGIIERGSDDMYYAVA